MAASLVPDRDGFPVLMADVPGSGVSTVDPDAKSGNPRHDTRSGKFGSGGGEGSRRSQSQINIDPAELRLMRDATRDAARQNEGMSPEDLEAFLKKRVREFDKVDFQQFAAGVREQRLEDLADILADQTRGRMKGGTPKIRVVAPRGYVKRVFAGLSDDEVVGLAVRMSRRGFSDEAIKRHVVARITEPERREALDARFGIERDKYS